MTQKFFGSIFARRKTVIPERKTQVSDVQLIKPAKDIADFEYPPESSFYQEDTIHSNDD